MSIRPFPDPLLLFSSSSEDDDAELDSLLDEELLLLLDEEEDDEDPDLFFFFFFLSRSSYITKLSRLFSYKASSYFSGADCLSSFSHLQDSFLRPALVSSQTFSKLPSLQKFSVTAIALSKLSTACHQPPGTKMVSPGR